MYAHDHELEALEEAAMAFIQQNALLFQREAMPTLSVLQQPLLLAVTGLIAAGLASAVRGGADAGNVAGSAASG